MAAIKPVFRDLAGVEPLKKCFHGKTHNPNKCVKMLFGLGYSELFSKA
jgi:hypothetical protein